MSSLHSEIDPESATIAKNIHELMLRKGIPKRSQSKKLKEILNLSLSQAHRKMNGTSNWELSQIRQVADFFGEPFDSFGSLFSAEARQANEPLSAGLLVIESRELPCKVQIGALLHTTKNVEFVARHSDNGVWVITEACKATTNDTYYKVKKLELVFKQIRKLSVAVLDDYEASADSLSDYLNATGFHADTFYDIDTLSQAVAEGRQEQFDAFVIDWWVGGKTAESLIQLIRAKEDPTVPILLLTGEMVTGRASESDVARMIVEYNVSLYEKPTRLPIIAANLSKALGVE